MFDRTNANFSVEKTTCNFLVSKIILSPPTDYSTSSKLYRHDSTPFNFINIIKTDFSLFSFYNEQYMLYKSGYKKHLHFLSNYTTHVNVINWYI